jgi:hypothetical protein
MELRTDRLGILVDQLVSSCEFARTRLEGLSDEEYLWEPAPGAWSARPRGNARTPEAFGPGDWVLDFSSTHALGREPVTTIAWRLGHLTSALAGRWEWTFGGRAKPPEMLVHFTPFADRALADLWELVDRWRERLEGLSDDQLDAPGFGQYPQGFDAQLPFIGIIWWMNRAFIHHTAEAALLRDLWHARVTHDRMEEAVGRRW